MKPLVHTYVHTVIGHQGVLVEPHTGVVYIIREIRSLEICPVCGHDFVPIPKSRRYCSSRCRTTAQRRRYRERQRTLIHE